MAPGPTLRNVLRRAGRMLAGACGLIGLVIGAGLIHLYTIEPPCRLQEWRAPGTTGCNQVLWFFGPGPFEVLAYLAGGFAACLLLAWIMSSRPRRRRGRRR